MKQDPVVPSVVWQYKANTADNKHNDELTAAWTYLFNPNTKPYSHSEFMFPDGTMFSAASRMGGGETAVGTRFADPNVVLRHLDRWDLYIKWVPVSTMVEYYSRACSIAGRPYYWAGLFLDFALPFGWISNYVGEKLNHWYCSQAVWYVITGKRQRVSPRRLQTWLQQLGYEMRANLDGIRMEVYGDVFKRSLRKLSMDISFLSNHNNLNFIDRGSV